MSDTPLDFTAQMPEYLSHKKVRALKILSMIKEPVMWDGKEIGHNYRLYFVDKRFDSFVVTEQFVRRSYCKTGGYLVRYEGGHLSWSPAEAFEDGYTRTSVDRTKISQDVFDHMVKTLIGITH